MHILTYPAPADITGIVYLAAPLHTFARPRYRRLRDAARAHFPAATLLEACDTFASTADWLARWPAVLATLAGLVFLTDVDASIGRGVLKEIMDAEDVGLPVYDVHDSRTLYRRDAIAIVADPYGDWSRFALVSLRGDAVPLAEWPRGTKAVQ